MIHFSNFSTFPLSFDSYYKVLYTFFALLLPTAVPIVFWDENPIVALFVCYFARSIIALNGTWSVNSAAHLFGTRPFDKTIFPAENWVVSFCSVGEGWHNYHHAFPWDYKASELGSPLNTTGYFIDFLAKMGQVYDRREATDTMIKNRVLRTGNILFIKLFCFSIVFFINNIYLLFEKVTIHIKCLEQKRDAMHSQHCGIFGDIHRIQHSIQFIHHDQRISTARVML